jgi:hypothetical protein
MQFVVEFGFSDLLFGQCHGCIAGGAGDGERYLGNFIGVAGLQVDVQDAVGFKAW